MTRSYVATHRALRRARGSARGRACVVCGRASSVWACWPCSEADVIDGTNASGRPVTYVLDLDGYAPMCWSHANAHDRVRAERRRATAHLAVSPLPPKPPRRRASFSGSHATPTLFDLIDGDMR